MADAQDIDGLLDLCDTLNVFSVSGRYPGDLMQVVAAGPIAIDPFTPS